MMRFLFNVGFIHKFGMFRAAINHKTIETTLIKKNLVKTFFPSITGLDLSMHGNALQDISGRRCPHRNVSIRTLK